MFTPRHLENNVIAYYNTNLNDNLLLQFRNLEPEEYSEFITKDVNSDEILPFQDWLLDSYSIELNSDTFEYLRYSHFNSFFYSSNVDRPRCLLSFWSSRRKINRHLVLKMTNYLMRKGNRQFSLNLVLKALSFSYEAHLLSFNNKSDYLNWQSIFFIMNNSYYHSNYSQFPGNIQFTNKYNFNYNYIGKEHSNFMDMRNVVLTNINNINPIFSFYIYKVDKAIYKNSRGKSGKYTFLWKYLPPYKRRQLVLAWIMKEVKMHSGRTLGDRLNSVISSIYSNPDSLFINKVQSFSTNYVYWNARKSLCETYRTSTK